MKISKVRPLVMGTPWRNLTFLILETDEGLTGVGEVRMINNTDALLGYIDRGIPVICSIQAWGDEKADYYAKDDNGHYVVAIGYDETHLYFMDSVANHEKSPANPRYGYLTRTEFLKRWHGDEGFKNKPEVYKRNGMVIHPDPAKTPPLLQAREIE